MGENGDHVENTVLLGCGRGNSGYLSPQCVSPGHLRNLRSNMNK